ncbi:MAG: hypothetical protein AAF184_13330 [Pseudomonadota bacterium]
MSLHGGPFDGRTFERRDCRVGLLLLVTGVSARGLDHQLYRVRAQSGDRFAASVEPDGDGDGECHRVLLPGTV